MLGSVQFRNFDYFLAVLQFICWLLHPQYPDDQDEEEDSSHYSNEAKEEFVEGFVEHVGSITNKTARPMVVEMFRRQGLRVYLPI